MCHTCSHMTRTRWCASLENYSKIFKRFIQNRLKLIELMIALNIFQLYEQHDHANKSTRSTYHRCWCSYEQTIQHIVENRKIYCEVSNCMALEIDSISRGENLSPFKKQNKFSAINNKPNQSPSGSSGLATVSKSNVNNRTHNWLSRGVPLWKWTDRKNHLDKK